MLPFLQSLFLVGISNAVIASGLAIAVLLLTWKSRWPAWTHAVWVLVLIKLICPPIVWLDSELPLIASQATTAMQPIAPELSIENVPLAPAREASEIQVTTLAVGELESSDAALVRQFDWLSMMSLVWLLGTGVCLCVTIYRWSTFRRWLGNAESAPSSMVEIVASVANQIQLWRVPKVLLVRSVMAPSVFSFGRQATLLLPVKLTDQLTDGELETVIAHELTHLKRGDHWVRLLELFSSALFWWHPVVPVARRKIHQSADESCDANVTSVMPDSVSAYASAMLKTVDFLSTVDHRLSRQASRASLTIAMGDSRSLANRMRRISRSATSPSISWRGRLLIAVTAVLVMPLGMLTFTTQTVAQQPPASQDVPRNNSDPFGTDDEPAVDDPFGGGGNPPGDFDPFGTGGNKSRRASSANVTKAPVTGDEKHGTRAERNQAVEAKLRATLLDEVTVTFIETPISEAIEYLSTEMKVPMIIDTRALEEIGLTPDAPIDIDVKNLSLGSTLRLILRNLDMTYMIKNEVIQITTVEVAEKHLCLKTYTLPVELADRSEKILTALKVNVQADTWEDSGGPSAASAIDNVLVVSTTERVHDEVESFLLKVEAAFKVYQKKDTGSEK